MKAKAVLYVVSSLLVIWSMGSLNINRFFKHGEVVKAQVIVFLIALAISYLVTNFIYDFYNCFKII